MNVSDLMFLFRQSPRAIPILLSVVVSCCLHSGCSGVKFWEQGRYFQMTLDTSVDPQSIRSVGIYVFSNGRSVDEPGRPDDPLGVISSVVDAPHRFYTMDMYPGFGADYLHFPDRVTIGSTLDPDTSNSGASLELATALSVELRQRGHNARVVTDLGHARQVSMTQVLQNAAEKNLDAVLVVHYTGITEWYSTIPPEDMPATRGETEYHGNYELRLNLISGLSMWTVQGFLYVPNAALIDVNSRGILWSNSYYGVVENAHTINLSDEPFVRSAPMALLPFGAPTYIQAAPLAAKILLDPVLWPADHKPFPERKRYQ